MEDRAGGEMTFPIAEIAEFRIQIGLQIGVTMC